MPANNVLFWPNSATRSRTFTVTDTPMRIIGNINPGDTVCVWRVYDGTSDECKTDKIPDMPVLCCDLCGHLGLWKQEYADCGSGYLTQSEVLIQTSGTFYLEYCCAEDDIGIWPPVETCPQLGGQSDVASEYILTFAADTLPDLDSAVLTDFKLTEIQSSGAGEFTPLSIAYDVAGQVTLTFDPAAFLLGATISYVSTGQRLTFGGECSVPDFTWIDESPVKILAEEGEVNCTETPDGVYVWVREELIADCGCD